MRRSAPKIEARAGEGGELCAPCPGFWRDGPRLGDRVQPGGSLGRLEILGKLHELIAPMTAHGIVVALPPGPMMALRALDAGALLVRLDAQAAPAPEVADRSASGPVFRSPLGGRYYARPSPGAEPFVKVGQVLSGGETVALIEVMKTFNRVQIAGVDLPARIARIAVSDGEDLQVGQILLELDQA